jgi:hypothetical protein
MSGCFKIGEPFRDILEYESYSFSHLYSHGGLIGKPITDNWQFRRISNYIKHEYLRKAELAEEYKLYRVNAMVIGGGYDFKVVRTFPAKTVKEAVRKMVRSQFSKSVEPTENEYEYQFKDGSGVIQIEAVELNDR